MTTPKMAMAIWPGHALTYCVHECMKSLAEQQFLQKCDETYLCSLGVQMDSDITRRKEKKKM